MAHETYLRVPLDFADFHQQPAQALADYGNARALRDLYLQMVIYAKTYNSKGFVPTAALCRWLAFPDSPRIAKRDAGRLADAGLIKVTEGGYHVPAAEEWSLQRVGSRDWIPNHVRDHVYERDNYRCTECGTTDDLALDHVIPWSQGGPDTMGNLRVLCRSCNSRKGARV